MFASTSSAIAEGDLVILYYGKDNLTSITVEQGKETNSRYGHFKHKDMVGTPYGTKFPSSNGKGFVYLLRPTPELWTQALPHRTQILYMPDIAFICSFLGIKPGSKVIEAGTGSGSFTHSVARTIGDLGHLYSFEFHEERYNEALVEFKAHHLNQVTLQLRNVCKDGFGDDLEQGTVDCIFLDLPAPWEAIAAAKRALKKNQPARICCFSPCIEQVIRTVTSLGANGFSEITMYEALTRQYEPFSPSDNGPSSVQDIITRLKDVVEKKDSRRLQQIERAKAKKDPQEKSGIDAKEGQEQTKPEGEEAQDDNVEEVEERPAKKARLDPDAESTAEAPKDSATANKPPPVIKDNTRRDKRKSKMITDAAVLRPMPQLRGHTSYLTFATLMPLPKQVNGTATVKEVASTEKPVEPKEEEANTQTKVTSATNGLKKTESLVQLADEDVEMLAEGVSFDLPQSLEGKR